MSRKSGLAIFSAILMTLLVGARSAAAPQRAGGPLSEPDVMKLLKMGARSDAVTPLVERYGVGFPADEKTLERLKQAGAKPNLLEAIRRRAPSPPPRPPQAAEPTAPRAVDPNLVEASRHLQIGQLRAKDRDYEGALREFAEAERIRPRWADAFLQRGLVLADLDRFREAAAELKKYVTLAASGADIRTYSHKIAEWEDQADKSERAGRLAEQGREQLRRLDPEGAVKSLQEAVRLAPSMSHVLDLARAYLLRGDYESLSRTATLALAVDPHSAQGLLYEAAAELGLGDVSKSLARIEEGLSFNPELAFGYALLAAAFEQASDSKAGRRGQGSASPILPVSASAHDRAGWTLWNGGDYPQALEELRKATQLEPQNPRWSSDLSYALCYRGDTTGALVAAREALRLNPSGPSTHDALGMALESRGRLDQAGQEYKEALRLSPPGQPAFQHHLDRIAPKLSAAAAGKTP